jgi:FkbM family methyltransferase
MSLLRKACTLAKLVGDADLARIRRGAERTAAELRLQLHGKKAFVYRRYGFAAVCHPDWPESRSQFLASSPDEFEFALIRKWMREGDFFVDVGTNKAMFSFAALDAIGGQKGGVVALEADEFACGKFVLSMRLAGIRNANCIHAAVTDREGTVTFHVSEDHASSEMQSLKPTDDVLRQGLKEVRVPATTLRQVSAKNLRGVMPAFVKMDIEGAETSALQAVPEEWLTEEGPLWIVEVNPDCLPAFGSTPRELCDRFPEESYDRWLMPKHPRRGYSVPALRRLQPVETFEDSWYYNLIAVPRGMRWSDRRKRVASLLGI